MASPEIEDDQRQRPLPDLLRDLSQELTTLVGKQLELAKVELSEKAKEAGQGAGMFGGAGLFGFLALGTFTAALIIGLSSFIPAWAAALAVAGLYGVVAGGLFARGKTRIGGASPPVPRETIDSARQTAHELQSGWSRGRA